jgi:hypothetical protein
VLFAIGQPASFVGLLLAYLLGLTLRVVAMRLAARALRLEPPGRLLPHWREDIDPFGAVAAAMVGTGWGRPVDIDAMPRFASKGRRAAVVAAGPLASLMAGLLALTAYRLLLPEGRIALLINTAGSVLRGGWAPSYAAEFLLSFAVGLMCFGLLALIPLPPLDGFALLWLSLRRPSAAGLRARHWLVDNNIGVVILLVASFFPLLSPFLHIFINLLAFPFLWIWA